MQPTFGGSIFFGSCATVRRDHRVDVDFKLNLSLRIKYWFPMTWLDDMWLRYSPVNWKASWFPVLNPIIARRLRRKITLFATFLQTKWDFLLIFLKIAFLLHKSRQHWGFHISNTLLHPFFTGLVYSSALNHLCSFIGRGQDFSLLPPSLSSCVTASFIENLKSFNYCK